MIYSEREREFTFAKNETLKPETETHLHFYGLPYVFTMLLHEKDVCPIRTNTAKFTNMIIARFRESR